MPVVLVHQGPTVTQENYDETVRKLTGKSLQEIGITDPPTVYPAHTFVAS